MSDYSINFVRSARKELERLTSREVSRIFARIEALTKDPRPKGCQKLVGESKLWRIRIGDYRVIYSIDDQTMSIDIMQVRHRSDVYR